MRNLPRRSKPRPNVPEGRRAQSPSRARLAASLLRTRVAGSASAATCGRTRVGSSPTGAPSAVFETHECSRARRSPMALRRSAALTPCSPGDALCLFPSSSPKPSPRATGAKRTGEMRTGAPLWEDVSSPRWAGFPRATDETSDGERRTSARKKIPSTFKTHLVSVLLCAT